MLCLAKQMKLRIKHCKQMAKYCPYNDLLPTESFSNNYYKWMYRPDHMGNIIK